MVRAVGQDVPQLVCQQIAGKAGQARSRLHTRYRNDASATPAAFVRRKIMDECGADAARARRQLVHETRPHAVLVGGDNGIAFADVDRVELNVSLPPPDSVCLGECAVGLLPVVAQAGVEGAGAYFPLL